MSFLVFDIGCIECGESSQPLALFESQDEALKFAEEYCDPKTYWGREEWHGQHSVQVFKLGKISVTK